MDRLPALDVVAPAGELDLMTTPQLRSTLLDATLCSQPVLVLDLSALGSLDSTS